ncbi:MAG: hypothetical protein ACK57D_12410 [Sphingobacteriales bacterium]|jgi:uncharacterized phage infection (PIP) family protein YhgE
MTSLTSIIEQSTRALVEITPQTLTPEHLSAAMTTLNALPVAEAIHAFEATLPTVPNKDEELKEVADTQGDLHEQKDQLNKKVSSLKQELNRIKEMQSALHIPQLDELIHSAQQVLRPIYDLTARME